MTTAETFAKARFYQRRIDAAIRRNRFAALVLTPKAHELRTIRAGQHISAICGGGKGYANDVADWLAWNGELVRSELRSWGARA